jgi:hypothetical protein
MVIRLDEASGFQSLTQHLTPTPDAFPLLRIGRLALALRLCL